MVRPFLAALAALAALVLPACTEPAPAGEDYTLRITLLDLPSNQQGLFADGVDSLQVAAVRADGSREVLDLGAASRDGSVSSRGLPELDGGWIEVTARVGDAVIARGRSGPIEVGEGDDVEVAVRMFATDAGNWLTPLAEGLAGATLSALGDGRFLLLGGATNDRNGDLTRTRDAAWVLDVRATDAMPAFAAAGTVPAGVTGGGEAITRRFGATATVLTAAGPDQGKVLLVGGSDLVPWKEAPSVSPSVALYDPLTDAWTDVAPNRVLTRPRSGHVAVENAQGSVVVYGGWGYIDDSRFITWARTVEVWQRGAGVADARTPSAFEDLGEIPLGPLGAAGADTAAEGTLLCGGADFDVDADTWFPIEACMRVTPDGTRVSDGPSLPVPTAGHAMVTLADGRILLAGGAHPTDPVGQNGVAVASDKAWIFDAGAWTPIGALNLPRAGHRMQLLADGSVLVAGGASEWGPFGPPNGSLACLERFQPGADRFVAVGDCDANVESADLPGRASEPAMASDAVYGALIVGGRGVSDAAQPGVGLYLGAE